MKTVLQRLGILATFAAAAIATPLRAATAAGLYQAMSVAGTSGVELATLRGVEPDDVPDGLTLASGHACNLQGLGGFQAGSSLPALCNCIHHVLAAVLLIEAEGANGAFNLPGRLFLGWAGGLSFGLGSGPAGRQA